MLNESSPAPELWQFALGALIGVQLAVHTRHLRRVAVSLSRAWVLWAWNLSGEEETGMTATIPPRGHPEPFYFFPA